MKAVRSRRNSRVTSRPNCWRTSATEASRPPSLHPEKAARAGAVLLLDDVEEEPVDRDQLEELSQVRLEKVHVRRVQADLPVEPRLEGWRSLERAVGGHLAPPGLGVGGELVPLDGDVDRHPDVAPVAGLDLLLEEVAPEVGVAPLREGLRVVVDVAVMAPAEAGDGVDPGPLEGRGELLGVELGPHVGDQGAGVEVEVDLAEAQLEAGAGDQRLIAPGKLDGAGAPRVDQGKAGETRDAGLQEGAPTRQFLEHGSPSAAEPRVRTSGPGV